MTSERAEKMSKKFKIGDTISWHRKGKDSELCRILEIEDDRCLVELGKIGDVNGSAGFVKVDKPNEWLSLDENIGLNDITALMGAVGLIAEFKNKLSAEDSSEELINLWNKDMEKIVDSLSSISPETAKNLKESWGSLTPSRTLPEAVSFTFYLLTTLASLLIESQQEGKRLP